MTTKAPTKRRWVMPASVTSDSKQAKVLPRPSVTSDSKPGIDTGFVPSNEAELTACLDDPMWRICSGQIYKIMVKAPDGEDNSVAPFVPNKAQRRLMSRLHHRNIIIKARQLGFTTLVAILWLDHALFNADQRCVIVAQDKDTAAEIFRDKVKLAYERLPEFLRVMFPLKSNSASEIHFAHNNSAVRVSTSARGGTPHRLHISEYGKICAKYPEKAKEVVTGSLPAVPLDGICIIESTAEGAEGDFYDKTKRAIAQAQAGTQLTQKDFRLHFYAWWQEPGYRLDSDVVMTDKDREYFDIVEAQTGTILVREQRNWYVATRDSEFGGDPEKMWQEYPSTILEPFQVSTEGTYYAVQLAAMRKEGRLCRVPHVVGVPVNTFWDIGNSDGTAIWFHQRVGFEDRFIDFMEGWGESYSFFVSAMNKRGYVWGTHYLPHDAAHKRQGKFNNQSPEDMLLELMPSNDFIVVPPVSEVIHGIQLVRDCFGSYFFDEEKCALGIAHLGNYKKTWDKARGAWKIHTPQKIDGHSEAADAIRQHAQGYDAPRLIEGRAKPKRNWRTS